MRRYPGESNRRQAVHTVYGGAHLFQSATPHKRLGEVALRSLEEYAPDARDARSRCRNGRRRNSGRKSLRADRREITPRTGGRFPSRFRRWLRQSRRRGGGSTRRFERGGSRARFRRRNASAVHWNSNQTDERRSARTQHSNARYFRHARLLTKTDGKLPENFVITVPKIQLPEQMTAAVRLFEILERKNGLATGFSEDRTDDRDTAGDHQRARGDRARIARSTPPKVVAKACTSASTITPRRAESPRAIRRWDIPPAISHGK